jgi:phage baseplate assembly protein W
MQSLKLADGDLVFDENGELIMIDGAEEVAQCAELALGTNQGEWFLNPKMGIIFRAFLDKKQSEEEMREQIRQGLFQEPRIKTVETIEFTIDRKNRTIEISFQATADTGESIDEAVTIDA